VTDYWHDGCASQMEAGRSSPVAAKRTQTHRLRDKQIPSRKKVAPSQLPTTLERIPKTATRTVGVYPMVYPDPTSVLLFDS
jgi:hypothetical protein